MPPSHGNRDSANCASPRLDLSFDPESLARFGAAFFPRASPGLVAGCRVPGVGAELGDGVQSGSLAGLGTRPIRGSSERTELEERWRSLCWTGRLRSEPGTVEVSHRYSQRRHFAQTGESECLPGGGVKGPRPIMVGTVCGSTLIDRNNGES